MGSLGCGLSAADGSPTRQCTPNYSTAKQAARAKIESDLTDLCVHFRRIDFTKGERQLPRKSGVVNICT
jgi:hypothetical protein